MKPLVLIVLALALFGYGLGHWAHQLKHRHALQTRIALTHPEAL
jgi:hypothetical protein